VELAKSTVARDLSGEAARAEILRRWGRRALVSLAYGIITAQAYPASKYAIGYSHACARARVGGEQLPLKEATMAAGLAQTVERLRPMLVTHAYRMLAQYVDAEGSAIQDDQAFSGDGGGKVPAVMVPVVGRERLISLILGLSRKFADRVNGVRNPDKLQSVAAQLES
jgi:hypothetical protein